MIYTVTFNPSLDYIVDVDNFTTGEVNRTTNELLFPGGKGINVSIVLKNLGLPNAALGFAAGFTGQEIRRKLAELDIDDRFIEVGKMAIRASMSSCAATRNPRSTARDRISAVTTSSSFIRSWTNWKKTMCWSWRAAFRP